MKTNELNKMMNACSTEEKFAILKALQKYKRMTYTHLKKFVNIEKPAIFAYHLRGLVEFKIIEKHSESLTYSITARGNTIVKFLETFLKEKYICDDQDLICINKDDGNHEFIEICRKCCYVKKGSK